MLSDRSNGALWLGDLLRNSTCVLANGFLLDNLEGVLGKADGISVDHRFLVC
jgi:hypothetical protein